MARRKFNPNNPDQLTQLHKAISASRKMLAPFRDHNLLSIKQLAGRFYGENSGGDVSVKVPVNMLELAFTIYRHHLSGSAPRVSATTEYREHRAGAYELELALNDLIQRIRLVDAQRAAVGQALLSMGVVKVGVESGENIGLGGEKPFVDAISLDHWVHDMTADCWPRVGYMGNRFVESEEIIKESKELNRTQSEKLVPIDSIDAGYDDGGTQRFQEVSTGQPVDEDGRIYSVVELWDIWFPMERMLITVDCNGALDKPLRVLELDDDEQTVYHTLSFCELAGNTMPLPPSALWMDLHLLANNIFRKLENQSKNSRNVTIFSGTSGPEDAARLDAVNDGGFSHLSNPQSVQTIKTTGVDNVNLAFLIQIKDLFSYFGGNIDALGGLGPQSPTLGQDEMLRSAASQRLAAMQDRTQDFLGRVIRCLAYYDYTGEGSRMLRKDVPGTSLSVNFDWNQSRRSSLGALKDYRIDLVPYSSSGTSPAMKLSAITNIFQSFILPLLPSMQAQGYSVDVQGLVETIARLGNLPEIENLIMANGVPIAESESGPTGKSPQTTRRYERVNRSQASRSTRDNVMSRALMGYTPQASEMGNLNGAAG